MNKRITSILLCFVMMFSMLATAVPALAAPASTCTFTVEADKSEAHRGDTITFTVYMQQTGKQNTLEFTVVPPEGLTYVANSGIAADNISATLNWTGALEGAGWTESSKYFSGFGSVSFTGTDKIKLMTFQCKVNDDAAYKSYEFDLTDPWADDETYTTKNAVVVPATFSVVAKPIAVTGVTIQQTLSVNIGQSATPTYVVNPAEATNKTVTFSSNNTAVATVNETTGEVTGVKKGTAVITVTTVDGNYTDTCTVTVSCAHTATTPVAAQTSDCKTPGWDAYKTCNACGQILSAQGAELQAIPYLPLSQNHVGGTATCLKKAVCTVCQKEYGNLADHKWGQVWDYKDANGHAHKCTETGCNAHDSVQPHTPNIPAATEQEAKVCTTCQYVIEPQKQHVHSTTRVPAEPASCTQSGNKEYYTCTCGKYFEDATANVEITNKDSVIIPEKGHDYSERIKDAAHLKTQASNCQEYDTYWYDCSRCAANAKDELTMGDKWYTSTDAGDHIMDRNWTQENDKHFHKCTVNGCTHTDTKTACSGGTATCQSKATCSTCNNPYGNVAEHDWSDDWTYREEDGHAKTCDFPGCTAQSPVEPHTPSEWQITDDVHSRYCTACQYNICVREPHKDTNDDGICDVCNRDSNVIVEIPFVKVVEQKGEATPGKQTFTFEIIEFGNSNANGEVDIVANTITTDGKGKFDGVIKLKLTEEELNDEDYLAEGLYIREKVETKEGWTYSDAVWYALFNEQTGVWEFFVVENNVTGNEAKAEMTFTNSYNAKNPVKDTNTNTNSSTKESPKTGDNNVLGLLVAVMFISGCGVATVYVYNRKRRYF